MSPTGQRIGPAAGWGPRWAIDLANPNSLPTPEGGNPPGFLFGLAFERFPREVMQGHGEADERQHPDHVAHGPGVLRPPERLGDPVVNGARPVRPGAEAENAAEAVGGHGPAGVADLGLDQVERDAEQTHDAACRDQAAG